MEQTNRQTNSRFPPSAAGSQASLAPPEPRSARTDGGTHPLSQRRAGGCSPSPGCFWGPARARTAFGRRGSLAALAGCSRSSLPASLPPGAGRDRGVPCAAPHSRGAASARGGSAGGLGVRKARFISKRDRGRSRTRRSQI